MHPLTEWLRDRFDGLPPSGPVDDQDVEEELEETPLGEGYEREE